MKKAKRILSIALTIIFLVTNMNITGVLATEETTEEEETEEQEEEEEDEDKEYFCGKKAHEHTKECYVLVLICEKEEGDDHTHSEECYEATEELLCEKEEHKHTEECETPKAEEEETTEQSGEDTTKTDSKKGEGKESGKTSDSNKGKTENKGSASTSDKKTEKQETKSNESKDTAGTSEKTDTKADASKEEASKESADKPNKTQAKRDSAKAKNKKKTEEEKKEEVEDPIELLTKYYEQTYTTKLQYPLIKKGSYTSRFGVRDAAHAARAHKGLDIAISEGTEVLAAEEGTVKVVHVWDGTLKGMNGYGNYVDIDHGNGMVTRYAHLSQINVEEDEVVKRGQQIGRVGNTGRSFGAHLHLEVIIKGVQINPEPFLGGVGGSILNIDYSSKRLLVKTENEAVMKKAPVIASYGDTYVLQYESEEDTRLAYISFFGQGAIVAVDHPFSLAEVVKEVKSEATDADAEEADSEEAKEADQAEETEGNSAEPVEEKEPEISVFEMTEEINSFNPMLDAIETMAQEIEVEEDAPIIALLDTGVGEASDFEIANQHDSGELSLTDILVRIVKDGDDTVSTEKLLNPYPNLIEEISLMPGERLNKEEQAEEAEAELTEEAATEESGDAEAEAEEASDEQAEPAFANHGTEMYNAIVEEAPDARILSIKVVDDQGNTDLSTLTAGLIMAKEYGADYIVLPVTTAVKDQDAFLQMTVSDMMIPEFDEDAEEEESADKEEEPAEDADQAVEPQVTIIVAAGDFAQDVEDYEPASVPGVVTVGRAKADGTMSEESNFGEYVDYNVISESTAEAASRMAGILYKNSITTENLDKLNVNRGKVFLTDYEVPEPPVASPKKDKVDRLFEDK